MKRPVAISGMGVLAANGEDVPHFSESLRAGRAGLFTMNGAELADVAYEDRLARTGASEAIIHTARRLAGRAPRSLQASIIVALQAWRDSQLDDAPIDPDRVGLVVAGNNISPAYGYTIHEQYRERLAFVPPRYALHALDTDHVGAISALLPIRGVGFSMGGASASGNLGLLAGRRMILAGDVDVCLVIGALVDLSPLERQALTSLGALGGKTRSLAQGCQPFDRQAEGFVPGMGAACLVLESPEHCAVRGANQHGVLAGGAMVLDGNRNPDPSVDGELTAMRKALRSAGFKAEDVDYLNAHGTASPLGDATELSAVAQLFGRNGPWLNATKGLTGHCLGAGGVVEAVATLIQLRDGFLHPNPWLANPIRVDCRLVGPVTINQTLTRAMSNAFGFGGINTSIVLTRANLS